MMKTQQTGSRMRYLLIFPLMAAFVLSGACSRKTDTEVLSAADKMPEYPGGQLALMEYLGKAVTYPQTAKDGNITGQVLVGFVIDKTGKVTNVEVKSGVHPDLDKEAVRVVQAMPNWQPGMHGGKAVNIAYALPIVFKLE